MAERLIELLLTPMCFVISHAVELLPDMLDCPAVQNQINA